MNRQRTGSRSLRFATVNAYNLYATEADEPRYRQLENLIRDLAADIVVVQEIISDGAKPSHKPDQQAAANSTERTAPLRRADPEQKRLGAERGLRRLAAATDHECEVNGEPAVAVGGIIHFPVKCFCSRSLAIWAPDTRELPLSAHVYRCRVRYAKCAEAGLASTLGRSSAASSPVHFC